VKSILQNVDIEIEFVELETYTPKDEVMMWWSTRMGIWKKATDALCSISLSESMTIKSKSERNYPRNIILIVDVSELSLHGLDGLLKTFGPAFQHLHKKGFTTCCEYNNVDLELTLRFDEKGWKWSVHEWNAYLEDIHRDRSKPTNDYGEEQEFDLEEVHAGWPIGKLIAWHMYQVDIDTE
jgi:hypothetical protein